MPRYKLRTLLIVILLGPIVIFTYWRLTCSQSSQPDSLLGESSFPATYTAEVHGGSFTGGGGGQRISAGAGLNFLVVEDEKLRVNGKEYGKLSNGDHILVEEDGTVKVNGKLRQPETP